MFGLFAKKPPYPELSVADQLLIDERKRADEEWYKLYLRREKLRFGDEAMRAYAAAVEHEAYQRKKLLNDQYEAMMKRLTAEAQAHLAAQDPRP